MAPRVRKTSRSIARRATRLMCHDFLSDAWFVDKSMAKRWDTKPRSFRNTVREGDCCQSGTSHDFAEEAVMRRGITSRLLCCSKRDSATTERVLSLLVGAGRNLHCCEKRVCCAARFQLLAAIVAVVLQGLLYLDLLFVTSGKRILSHHACIFCTPAARHRT